MDRNDVVGIVGAGLLGAGVWSLAGWAWASILWGSLLLAMYALLELIRARRPRGGGG